MPRIVRTHEAVQALADIGAPTTAVELAAHMGVTMWQTTTAIQPAVRDGRLSCIGFRPRRYIVNRLNALPDGADPMTGIATPYLMENYIPVPESGCWLWLGSWQGEGYGKISSHGRNRAAAHRLFYFEKYGPIPPGMVLCHKCDTPPCVNPDHMFVGTYKDNMQDMIRKGRGHHQRKAKILQAATGGEG